ncbi:hypothetical protein N658DRAFT_336983 [Parathielavia hyrcaniae]|uniref:Uncharacterized protein n=1 Tax=Parathielavia hyrcaniae TaxID=113614 RepID=A0AAN6Q7H9_9PEZI|nr:hypothetical protein N658DRAFT_336983 [Parathielavia hyrcaniae]
MIHDLPVDRQPVGPPAARDNVRAAVDAHLHAALVQHALLSALAQARQVIDAPGRIPSLEMDLNQRGTDGNMKHTGARVQPGTSHRTLFWRRPPTASAAWAAARASSTVRAVSGVAMMSSTHCAKEKTVVLLVAAGAATTDATRARVAARGKARLTLLATGLASILRS